jgi:hypothetical protein
VGVGVQALTWLLPNRSDELVLEAGAVALPILSPSPALPCSTASYKPEGCSRPSPTHEVARLRSDRSDRKDSLLTLSARWVRECSV